MSDKVLIVEDEPNIVLPLQFSLERKGYEVKIVGSGEDALELLPIFLPDLVLLDIMLPGIDGYEVCQNIRENPKLQKIIIIYLSAMGRDIDVAKGITLAADAYIVKPFSIIAVLDKVSELLKNRNL
jgi:DNA-binding response OmpR family regulator